MKRILIITFQLLVFGAFAQAPQLINYQGVARNAQGDPLVNRTLGIKFEIFQGSSVTAVFTETNTVVTNNLGLFTTQIGKKNTTGIGNIDFGAGSLSLKIGIDSTGGSNFVNMGTQSLVSVPFSMYAASVPATYTNNILTIGKSTFTLNTGNQAIYTSSTGISIISSSIITNTLPDQTVTIVPGNSNVNVSGTYPNFTVATTPSLGISGNSLSISNGNTVTLPSALPQSTLTSSGIGTVTSAGTNSFNINVPQTNLAGAGSATVSGTFPNYTVSAPAATPNTTLTGAGSATVSGTFPNYTVSAPAATPNTTLTGAGSATVSGTFPNYTVSAPAPTPNTTLTGAGSATVSGTFPNYTVSAPAATPSTNLSGTGAATVTGSFPNYTVNAPAATPSTNLSGTGAATVTGSFPNYTVNAPAATPSTNLSGTGAATVTGSFPNYTVNAPAATPSTNLSGTGAATVTGAFPNYTVNAPAATPSTGITQSTNVIVSGAFPNYTIASTPTLSLIGNNLGISGGNTIAIPSNTIVALTTTLQTGGAAQLTTFGPNDYSVHVPPTNVTSSGIGTITSSGTNSFDINVPQTNLSSGGSATVTGVFPNYTVSAPAANNYSAGTGISIASGSIINTQPDQTVSISSAGAATVTGTYPNFTVNAPAAGAQSTLTASGIGTVTSSGTNSFNINIPQTNLASAGSATVTGTFPNYTVSAPAAGAQSTLTSSGIGTITTAGTNSFNINIPQTNLASAGSATVTGTFPNYTVSAPAAGAQSTLTSSGIGTITTAGTNSFNINIPQTNLASAGSATVTGTFPNYTVSAPAAGAQSTLTSSGIGTITTAGTNSFNINIPQTNLASAGAATVTGAFPNYTVNAPAAGPQSTLTSSGIGTITTAGTNSFNINIPQTNLASAGAATVTGAFPNYTVNAPAAGPQSTLTSSGIGTITTAGTNSFNINIPQTNLASAGAATVTGAFPNYTVNAPAAGPQSTLTSSGIGTITTAGTNSFNINIPQTNLASAGAATVTGAFPNYTVNAPAAGPQSTLTSSGIGTITTAGTNSFNINIPQTNLASAGAATVTGAFPNYTVNAPAAGPQSTLTSSGIGTITTAGTNSFNINIPQTNLASAGAATVTGAFPNYTVNAPAAGPQSTLTSSGIGTITTAGTNSFNINIPQTNLASAGAATVTGAFPNYTVNAPAAGPQSTLTSSGIGTITTAGTNSFNINIPQTNLASAGAATVTGAFPNYTVNAPAAGPQSTLTSSGIGTITTAGTNSFNINIPQTNLASAGAATVTGAFPNYTVNAPAAGPQSTLTSSGIGTITTAGTNSFNINIPQTNLASAGAATVTGAFPNYTVNAPAAGPQSTLTSSGIGTITTAGTNSFNINIPQTNLASAGAATVTGAFPNYTVNAPAAGPQSTLTSSGIGTITSAGTNSFNINIPQSNLTSSGIGTVTSAGTNSFNINIPQTNLASAGAATVTGAFPNYTVNAPAAGPQSTLTSSGIGTITTAGTNSFNINIPQTNLASAGAATVTGAFPNYTVNAPAAGPQSTLTSSGIGTITTAGTNSFNINIPQSNLTSSGIGTITSAGTNSFNINIPQTNLASAGGATVTGTFPNYTVNAPAAGPQSTLTSSGIGTITSAGTNSFNINIPQSNLTSSGIGTITSAGTNSFNINIPQTNLASAGAATVTGAFPNYTVNAPAAGPQSTLTSSGIGTITSAGTNSFNINIPQSNLTSSGIGTVTSAGTNSFNINIPQTNIASAGAATVTGTFPNYTVSAPAATPSTNIIGTSAAVVSSVSPGNFTVDVPFTTVTQGTNIVVSGAYPNFTVSALPTLALNSGSLLSISGGNTVTIPATNISLTTGTAVAASISTVGLNNFSLNIPSAITPTITPSGVLSRTASGSSFTLDVPAPAYVAATGALNTGTASVNITPLATFVGTVLTVGPTSNTVGIPFTQTTSIIGTGAALVTSNTAANYTVNVPQTSLTQSTNININGTYPSFTISALPTLALASGSVLSISGGNSVVFPALNTIAAAGVATVSAGPNYTVGVPATNIAMTFSAGSAGVSTTSANNFNLNIPSPNITISNSIAAAPAIQTVTANNYNINIPAVNNSTLWSTSGNAGTSPATNFVGTTDAQDLALRTQGSEKMRVTTGGNVGIGQSAPSENLQVETSGNTAVSIIGAAANVANISFGTSGNHTLGNIRYNNSTNSMNFWTNNTANRLVLDNAGNVGIGLAAPTFPLHVNGDVKANYLHGDVINDSGLNQPLRLRGNGPVLFVADDNNDDITSGFTWYNNGEAALNIQMLLDNSGNLGIGNSSPTQRVDITGNLKFSGALMPNNLPGTAGYLLTSSGAGIAPTWQNPNGLSWGLLGNSLTSTVTNFVGTTDNVGLAFRTNSAIRMSILNTGNVTVGTPSNPEPDGLLNVVSNNTSVNGLNGVFLDIQNSSNTTNNLTGIRFTGSSLASAYMKTAILVPYTNGSFGVSDMIFALNNVLAPGAVSTADARMIIRANGRVGIGIAAPDATLNVEGSFDAGSGNSVTHGQSMAIGLGNSVSGAVSGAIGSNNTVVGNRAFSFGNYTSASQLGSMVFGDWSGSTPSILAASTNDEFSARFANGYRFFTDAALTNTLGVYFSGAGNVGIGNATPQYKLSVFGPQASALGGPNVSFVTSEDAYPTMHFLNWNHSEQWIYFNSYYDGSYRSSSLTGNYALVNVGGTLRFRTAQNIAAGSAITTWTDAITMKPNGQVGIGTNAPTYNLHCIETISTQPGIYSENTYVGTIDGYGVRGRSVNNPFYGFGGYFEGGYMGVEGFGNGTTGTTAFGLYGFASGSTGTRYGVFGTASGGVTNYAGYFSGNLNYTGLLNGVSDRKFKKDILPLTGALDRLMLLQPKTYYMKTDEYKDMNFAVGKQMGLISQEVEEVFPELVTNDVHPGPPDNKDQTISYKGLNYIGLTPVMIQAIKEQQQQIEDLKKQIAEQQNQIDQLLKK